MNGQNPLVYSHDAGTMVPAMIEPRRRLWAVAEICWQDESGSVVRASATLEDTSASGACIRVRRPLPVGAKIHVKWQREQFSAVAKNCRADGYDFLLGVHREAGSGPMNTEPVASQAASPRTHAPKTADPQRRAEAAPRPIQPPPTPGVTIPEVQAELERTARSPISSERRVPRPQATQSAPRPARTLPGEKRKTMEAKLETKTEPKTAFPKFWRRHSDSSESAVGQPAEAAPSSGAAADPASPRVDLLSYEDIYRGAGILTSAGKYGIHKVVEMLNSERIRELPPEARRASVLMALDASGTSVEDLRADASHRQRALDNYESAQRKRLDDLEARKTEENSALEAEMERVRAHYAERMQKNLNSVTQEKEAVRNWQMAVQHEVQRIGQVLELCGNPSMAAAAGAGVGGARRSATESGSNADDSAEPVRRTLRPSLLSGD